MQQKALRNVTTVTCYQKEMKKDANIYRPKHSKIYYANYRTKINDPVQGEITVQRNLSTGLVNRQMAQKFANDKRQQDLRNFLSGNPIKVRSTTTNPTTCGEIIDCYLLHSQLTSKKEVVKDFCILVAEGLNHISNKRENFVRSVLLSALSAEQLKSFRDQIVRVQLGLPLRSLNNICAIMGSGMSIFSRHALDYYKLRKLPMNVKEWMEVPKPKRERGEDESFQPIDEHALAKMDKAAHSLMLRLSHWHARLGNDAESVRWRNAHAVYWLMRRCGLRNIEVQNLRWEWFEVNSSNIRMALIKRPYWRPKQSGGRVPVAHDLYAELLAIFGPSRGGPDGYVLHGQESDRYQACQTFVNKFVRRYINGPRRQKGAYELRKQYGSEMAARYDIATAAHLLRHKGLETAYKHYYTPLKGVQPL
jgi:hypothetical protein